MQDILGQNGLRAGSFLVRKKDVQSQGSFKLKPGQTAPGGSWALSYVRRGGTISTMNSTSILTISTHFSSYVTHTRPCGMRYLVPVLIWC